MVFTDIRLQNYRSYNDSSFDLGPGVTIVVGPNAVGKSNLIEAILIMCNSVNYRGKNGLIKQDKQWARIDAHNDQNVLRTVKITQIDESIKKEFVVDEKTYKRLPSRQKQPAVLFEPNNLFLLHGEPGARRDFIDNLAGQMNPEYLTSLSRYKRSLAQRNALLKSGSSDKNQLFVWDVRLSELAGKIVEIRMELIEKINKQLEKTYNKIAKSKAKIGISYKSSLGAINYTASMLKKLESELNLDMARGFTGSGPHRDDMAVTFNKTLAAERSSRGEIRTLILALKMIEMDLLERQTKTRPTLLLDDVFSELDGARRQELTQFLQDYQTIITTTDADVILKNFSQNCQIIPLS